MILLTTLEVYKNFSPAIVFPGIYLKENSRKSGQNWPHECSFIPPLFRKQNA